MANSKAAVPLLSVNTADPMFPPEAVNVTRSKNVWSHALLAYDKLEPLKTPSDEAVWSGKERDLVVGVRRPP